MIHCYLKYTGCIILCLLISACKAQIQEVTYNEKGAITISSPSPAGYISSLSLNETQKKQVINGNTFALRLMQILYSQEKGSNLLLSPLSLQYALAMTTNGAAGLTAEEITKTIGCGNDLQDLNAFMKILLEQLPALDEKVELKVTNAMLVNNDNKVQDNYKDILANGYYAPVEYIYLSDKSLAVSRINDWANRNTNGFIDSLVNESDLPDNLIAMILNALYFKAKWASVEGEDLFVSDLTLSSQPFYCTSGKQISVDYMRTSKYLQYTHGDSYQAIELPYSNGAFAMYVLLPDSKDENGLGEMLCALPDGEWKALTESFAEGPEVHLSLPKFDITEKYRLRDVLRTLGIKKAFASGDADFSQMFEDANDVRIDEILQKSRISVAEWGTEAASATAELMGKNDAPQEHQEVLFTADHPFVFVIAESTSGTILFEGIFCGE